MTLSDLYAAHRGKLSDKWSIYLSVYERLFSEYRKRPITLLEIGVQNGGSLELWSRYFSNAEKIVGCDINPACSALAYADPRISLIVGDANTEAIRRSVLQQCGEFDIAIDDGSHMSGDIVRSFFRYFPNISDGGMYVAEDLHCSYWREYQGGLFYHLSSISFFKLLADAINHEHWGINNSPGQLLSKFASAYGIEINDDILQQVHSVEFLNSICVVRKNAATQNRLGPRIISGAFETVTSGTQEFNGTICAALPQTSNVWSVFTATPSDACMGENNSPMPLDAELSGLRQQVVSQEVEIFRLTQELAKSNPSTNGHKNG
jgi:hypothetical protein